MSDGVLAAYWATPAIARNLTTATVVLTLLGTFGVIPAYSLFYHPSYLFQVPPHLWRLVTGFLIAFEGGTMSLLFDAYHLYRYCVQLETGNPRFPRKVDLIWYILLVCSWILMMDYLFGFNHLELLPGLILAMVYTATRDQRGQKVQYFFFTIPAQAVPFCMIVISMLMLGGKPMIQLEGLLAAHMYDFLTRIYPEFGGGPVLRVPAWLESIVQTPRIAKRTYGTAVRPSGPSTGSSTGAETGGPLPDSWKSRGKGHRLG
ncbi:hypothetical protein BHE90_007091 [Fusarium euwallaceae]|uniref:Derlin n=1 Tax=Fusarium euwallaceae TaxID=1147111 RepID=A0A430LRQ2_9HYPO|nr:hypothetical protein BHE90_007091 [Fusarium euwallaceae]